MLILALLCSPALCAAQISTLSDIADITVADHMRPASIPEIGEAILAAAPARFALAGLSMGGYIACDIIRQASDRVTRLALLDTGARADPPERRQGRLQHVSLAEQEGAVNAQRPLLPMLIHPQRLTDDALVATIMQMATDTGVEAFKIARQGAAVAGLVDQWQPGLASLAYSCCSQRAKAPPSTPPMMGATQNSQSWLSAVAPPKTALPRLRAGLKEAFEMGIAIRWMAVNVRPIASGAKPAGARRLVTPMMMNTRKAVSTSSIKNTEARLACSMESEP